MTIEVQPDFEELSPEQAFLPLAVIDGQGVPDAVDDATVALNEWFVEAAGLKPEDCTDPDTGRLNELGELAIQQWYEQNGLGAAQYEQTTRVNRATSLAEKWSAMGGTVFLAGDPELKDPSR